MAVPLIKFQSASENFAKGVYNFTSDATSTITVALTNTEPLVTYSDISQISQINYSGLSSRRCNISYSVQQGGEYKLKLANIILTTDSTIPTFQYVVLYDAIPGKLIGYYNYGAAINLNVSKRFRITFNDITGVFKIK